MCSSKVKLQSNNSSTEMVVVSKMNGRPVLQPYCNRTTPILERRNSLKKGSTTTTTATTTTTTNLPPAAAITPPLSPKLKSPRQPAIKRGNDPINGLNTSAEKVVLTHKAAGNVKKSRNLNTKNGAGAGAGAYPAVDDFSVKYNYSSSAPGSIAAARREQVAVLQVQRKMKIAHYGRTKSAKYEGIRVFPLDNSSSTSTSPKEEKRCHFITSNSDPIYIAYHDEEWGVPIHDDMMLFELLVLTGAQVGSDWTTVLKRRQNYRDAFSEFDPETVSKFSEKKMISICSEYGIEMSQVRGIVDNAKRILEIKRECGSFDKYLWNFVNHKPIATQYKSSLKIPVKTSKSESISKDMVRRGFRLVGPTVIHSFMQAAGLTNDHLITCTRHLHCVLIASQPPIII